MVQEREEIAAGGMNVLRGKASERERAVIG